MHRSRLYGVFVDAPVADAETAVGFWADALGAAPVRGDDDDPFVALYGAAGTIAFEVQAVDDTPRYHVDIETDDVAAEVARLQELGAVEESRWRGCHTLRVPGGHLLCVIPVHSDPETFTDLAQTWPANMKHKPARQPSFGAPRSLRALVTQYRSDALQAHSQRAERRSLDHQERGGGAVRSRIPGE
jgi:catechol 2,3-dioxygenase-like lactoylglutathione lyase family enzyme